MKIPYASPNLRATDFIRALFLSGTEADNKIKKYFSDLTGKKYVLITNSCRSALFLAYRAINATGEVITSPLTCKVAIDPIVESGNTPIFADISPDDLNIKPEDIEPRINDKTIAIQAIHLGGVSCDMDRILPIAGKRNIPVIEDCAQSLGAVYKGKPAGSFGAVSCFSLIKNAYGIGGGILATDDLEIYQKAQSINDSLDQTAKLLVIFRIARNILDTKRQYSLFFSIYRFVMSLRRDRQNYKSVKGQLRRITSIEKKIAAGQIDRLEGLHEKRKRIGKQYCDGLIKRRMMRNQGFDAASSSFTKLFVYHPAVSSRHYLAILNEQGIEAMHLEQKYGSPFQERIVPEEDCDENKLPNYNEAHECLISLPIAEYFGENEIEFITETLEKISDDSKQDNLV